MRQPPEFGFTTQGDKAPGVTTIDMTPDGRMAPPPVSGLPWTMRIGIGAVIVAAVAGLAASAVLLLWLASILIPVAIVAAAIAYAALRFQLWRHRARGGVAGTTVFSKWEARLDPRRTRP